MKKILFSLLALAFCGSIVSAEEMTSGPKDQPMKHMRYMKDKKGAMGMMGMKGGMCPREIVATSDGGVVVLVGNKLMKYDRDLNLKKEAEIKIDREAMKKMMAGCPMMNKDAERAPEGAPMAEPPVVETAPAVVGTSADVSEAAVQN